MSGLLSHVSDGWQRAKKRRQASRFADAARQVHGPDPAQLSANAIVVCVPQWRVGDLSGFYAHYRQLGATHFVFFASATPPEALAKVQALPDTIIVENGLRVAVPEAQVAAHLTQSYGMGKWCLTVPSDALLAFPGDATLGLRGLTAYLDQHEMTALRCHGLDMFAKGPVGAVSSLDLSQKIKSCVYFDLSAHLSRQDEANRASIVTNAERGAEATSMYPFVRNPAQPNLEAMVTTRVGDVTAVLKSYRLATDLSHAAPDNVLFSLNARRWNRAELLVRNGFLKSSAAFDAWAQEYGA